jgi:hypothetical protein
MGLIIPPGYLHAVYRFDWTNDAEEMVTTCGHEIDSASGASGEQAADDLMDSFADFIMVEMVNEMKLVGVDVYVGNDGPAPFVYTSSLAAVTGSSSAAALPPNSAYLVRKRTDLAGRRGRGRFYIPGVKQAQVFENGDLNSTQVTQMNTVFGNWHTFLTAGAGARLYPPVVLHRSEGIGEEPLPTPVQSFICDGKIATQRRRLRP